MLGVVAYFQLPVSLMPDIDIPEITVQIDYPNSSASELENTVVKHIRRNLMQLSNLKDIKSKAQNGYATIMLQFEYGTDINYAFIETNEKIDGIMSLMPRDIERPKVIQASSTDIPVFYLNISLRSYTEKKFIELSDFCENVIKRHIEQLPQVAMVDLSGKITTGIIIEPDNQKITALNITIEQIRAALLENNVEPGNLLIRDGQYQYHVKFTSVLRTKNDIENIYINAHKSIIQLKDIAQVRQIPIKQHGMFIHNNQRAITMAVIKQGKARMSEMKYELSELVKHFVIQYPELSFDISQDQTRLLDYSINNLKNSLIYGLLLVIFIMLVFLKNLRSSFLSGISIPVSLIVSLLFFMFFDISLNIISLSGLILAVGMMIDNSIIVIDNISQHYERSNNLEKACIDGTNEVIRPLLSSALTTSAIFLPLIFLSGISGALFFDQAITVSIGLAMSYIVSITLLPCLYFNIYKKKLSKSYSEPQKLKSGIKKPIIEKIYEKGFNQVFKSKKLSLITFIIILPAGIWMFMKLEKKKLPKLTQTEVNVNINWNENINTDENRNRINSLFAPIDSFIIQKSCFIGQQQFLIAGIPHLNTNEAQIYINSDSEKRIDLIREFMKKNISKNYPYAKIDMGKPTTIFEKLFSSDETPLIVKLSNIYKKNNFVPEEIIAIADTIDRITNNTDKNKIAVSSYLSIEPDFKKLLLYGVSFNSLINKLKAGFNEYYISNLKANQQFIPIIIGSKKQSIDEIFNNLKVKNNANEEIPVRTLVKSFRKQSLKDITAGKDGVYYELKFKGNSRKLEKIIKTIKNYAEKNELYKINFSGSFFSQQLLIRELLIVLSISLLLLYFILAAQFESLIQPLIVLLEVPIDFAGAFFMLWIFGISINIMAMIGIVVMSGIIINDSILKIDTINNLRKSHSLTEAIKKGGHRRIRPIIMTSLTTIFALFPFLFSTGMGAELQLPLALTVIGGMIIGTFVSLYFIPLCYWFIYSKPETDEFQITN